jgi:hypothetical protein
MYLRPILKEYEKHWDHKRIDNDVYFFVLCVPIYIPEPAFSSGFSAPL